MELSELTRYKKIYTSSDRMGAACILRKYLNLGEEFPIPLSISHGVDLDNSSDVVDAKVVEPIHWAYNENVYTRACRIKAAVKLPHPWMILRQQKHPRRSGGVLIIGPPPGTSNDKNLLRELLNRGITSGDLLLKFRGTVESSRSFWLEKGFGVVSAGYPDRLFYHRLFDIISRYELIVSGTLSSAVVFGSALNTKCELLENYFFSAYDVVEYLDMTDFASSRARTFVRLLRENKQKDASYMAQDILGESFLGAGDELKEHLMSAIASLKYPVYFGSSANPIMRSAMLAIALRSGRSGFISNGIVRSVKSRINPKVNLITLNEIDIWINGLNERNFGNKQVPYIKNVTEPGWAID